MTSAMEVTAATKIHDQERQQENLSYAGLPKVTTPKY